MKWPNFRGESSSSEEKDDVHQHHHSSHKDEHTRFEHPPGPAVSWAKYPIADPAVSQKLSKDIQSYCSADFEKHCLSQSTGLVKFCYFAGHHHDLPYPVLPGVEEPLFDSVRGRGRRAIEDLRLTLYIHETPSSELHCLVEHRDMLQSSCNSLLTRALPPPEVLPPPPEHHPHGHIVVIFIAVAAVYYIIKKKLAKRHESVVALLDGLHRDTDLKAQVGPVVCLSMLFG